MNVEINDSEALYLDAETRADLNLFEPEGGSLFDYCDRCRTEGGRKALRRRMETPWKDPERIRGTQEALSCIAEHPDVFAGLPSEYTALNTERYLNAAIPVIRHEGALEFNIAATLFKLGDDQFYTRVMKGVGLTRKLIARLLRLSRELDALEPKGELIPIARSLSELLHRPRLVRIRDRFESRRYRHRLRCDQAFRVTERAAVQQLLVLIYELDALVSLAEVHRAHGFTMPVIHDGALCVEAEGLVYPGLENAVGNPVDLSQTHRLLFLTGPNMAGKTTYMRALAVALYLAHLGMGVPAKRFAFVPAERLITAIALQDDLVNGISYFRAEALRMKAVAESVGGGYRTVAVIDEPFKGTNVKDAFDASREVIERLAVAPDCLFVVSSHLIELQEALAQVDGITYGYFQAEEEGKRLSFDYRIHPGVSDQRLGMRVLREEGVFDLLKR